MVPFVAPRLPPRRVKIMSFVDELVQAAVYAPGLNHVTAEDLPHAQRFNLSYSGLFSSKWTGQIS